ncbi:MAG: MGMT family protein [Dehalococcoidia bacterium]
MGRRSNRRDTFYDRVYGLVEQVTPGTVVTYGQVAVLLGAPAAARAVGYSLRALPVSSGVPWWRVINAQGRISLRGRGPGADLQREILISEGVEFDSTDTVDLARFRWWPPE